MDKWTPRIHEMTGNLETLLAKVDTPVDWYRPWGTLVIALGARFGLSPLQSCALFASMSPRKSIGRNWACYEQALFEGIFMVNELTGNNRRKAENILGDTSGAPIQHLGHGLKTIAFAHALNGASESICVDSITAQAALNDRTVAIVRPTLYRAIEASIASVAWRKGWAPVDTQATIWVAWRKAKVQGWKTFYSDPNPLDLLSNVNYRPLPMTAEDF